MSFMVKLPRLFLGHYLWILIIDVQSTQLVADPNLVISARPRVINAIGPRFTYFFLKDTQSEHSFLRKQCLFTIDLRLHICKIVINTIRELQSLPKKFKGVAMTECQIRRSMPIPLKALKQNIGMITGALIFLFLLSGISYAQKNDFDGDGKSDLVLYDAEGLYGQPPGSWYFMLSSNGFRTATFGYAETVPVSGDFDGDGTDDYGVYDAAGHYGQSPGSWYFMTSSNGFSTKTFGYAGTVLVVGDYDGDGKDDYGCYDAAGNLGQPAGSWYMMQSTASVRTETFGYPGTMPLGTHDPTYRIAKIPSDFWLDEELREIAYSDHKYPDGFYQEELEGGNLYYENTVSINEGEPIWIELDTMDYAQALEWSELSSAHSAYYRDLVDERETEKYFEFRRIYSLNPTDIILSRVHKTDYLDKSMYDHFSPDNPILGIFNKRPVDTASVRELIEYMWFALNYNFLGSKVLESYSVDCEEEAKHILVVLSIAYGDWGIYDQITLGRLTYTVNKTTGEIIRDSEVLKTILGNFNPNPME